MLGDLALDLTETIIAHLTGLRGLLLGVLELAGALTLNSGFLGFTLGLPLHLLDFFLHLLDLIVELTFILFRDVLVKIGIVFDLGENVVVECIKGVSVLKPIYTEGWLRVLMSYVPDGGGDVS